MNPTARHVAITGANRGLGLELARQCSARGDHVLAGCRTPGSADALRALDRTTVLALDVSDPASIAAFGAAVGQATPSVDLLFNNAGVNGTAFGAHRAQSGVLELDPESFLGQMRVNALGPMLVVRAMLPLLKAAERSVIVNVSSQLGSLELGAAMRRDIGYNASKAALNMITRALSGTLAGDGIIAVTVHPGWIATDMGGPDAPLAPQASAAALLRTIGGLGVEDSGAFLTWDGTPHPW